LDEVVRDVSEEVDEVGEVELMTDEVASVEEVVEADVVEVNDRTVVASVIGTVALLSGWRGI
jgi:hypothetical protein